MKKLLVLSVLLIFLLVGCSTAGSSLEQQEGIIASIRESQDGWNQILVISNVDEADISNKTEEVLRKIAQEKNGAYYGFKSGKYDNLEWEGALLCCGINLNVSNVIKRLKRMTLFT